MQFLCLLALFRKRRRVVSDACVWSMSAGSRCWQQRAERLSEGLWACSSLYEEIKSVKCHGLMKAGGDFCHPVLCAVLIKKTRWKCRLSAHLFGFVQQWREKSSLYSWLNWNVRVCRLRHVNRGGPAAFVYTDWFLRQRRTCCPRVCVCRGGLQKPCRAFLSD